MIYICKTSIRISRKFKYKNKWTTEKKIPINSRREACYLEFLKPALFTHLKTNFKEHYYEYKGGFVNVSFDILFKILDKNKKVIVKNDYFAIYAQIYSEQ